MLLLLLGYAPDRIEAAAIVTAIRPDGTLGTQVAPPSANGVYTITGGRLIGDGNRTNLFHSFSTFSIGKNDTALFADPAGLRVNSIVGRVTGGEPSNIFGQIQVDPRFGAADLYLLNPNGVLFGMGASLNLNGSFHASTADYLRFRDGNVFPVDPKRTGVVLSSAAVESFGFLGNPPGPLTVESARLQVGAQQTLALVGGDIRIAASALTANNGRIHIEAGKLTLQGSQLRATAIGNRTQGGDILISARELSLLGRTTITTACSIGATCGNIRITSTERVLLTGGSSLNTATSDNGNAGNIVIKSPVFIMAEKSGLLATSTGTGEAGNIQLRVRQLELQDGSRISNRTAGDGSGGKITIGSVSAPAQMIVIRTASQISSNTDGKNRGDVTIYTQDMVLSEGGNITAESLSDKPVAARSGTITLHFDTLRLQQGGRVSVETQGADAGDVLLQGGKHIILQGDSSMSTTVREQRGGGGNVTLNATLVILSGASQIIAEADKGRGGQVVISTPGGFFLRSPDSLVSAASGDPNLSGTVTIKSPDTNLFTGLAKLPQSMLNAGALLRERCAQRALGFSSFRLRGDSGKLTALDETYLPASYPDIGYSRRHQARPAGEWERVFGVGVRFSQHCF